MQATGGSYAITDMVWLTCHDQVILQTIITAVIGKRALQWQEAILFSFNDGLKSRIDLFRANPSDLDRFFATPG